jgi:hypothetical protein
MVSQNEAPLGAAQEEKEHVAPDGAFLFVRNEIL